MEARRRLLLFVRLRQHLHRHSQSQPPSASPSSLPFTVVHRHSQSQSRLSPVLLPPSQSGPPSVLQSPFAAPRRVDDRNGKCRILSPGVMNVRAYRFSSSASEEPSSSSSWFQRLKGLFLGQEKVQTQADGGAVSSQPSGGTVTAAVDDLNLEKFADELRKAQAFGKLTQFGRGLPRGGEAVAACSLQRQEEILRKLASYSPDGQRLEAKHKSEVATQCGCTVKDVNDVLGKYEWAREANARMMRLKAEGKPLPKSLDEVEKMMGSRWKAAASVNLSKDSQSSRNVPCPCGSGKKYKRCCGKL
ncbi:unnamed protein product [Calypogeia fissa]